MITDDRSLKNKEKKRENNQVSRSWLRNLIIVFFITVITMIFIEVVLRFVIGNMENAPYQIKPGDGRCIGLVPGASVKYTGWYRRVPPVIHDANRFGYRGKAYPRERHPDTFRIAVMGDSFVYGQGVSWDCAMPVFIEKSLSEHGINGIQVLNFGIPGINLEDNVEQYRFFVKNYNPDMVLLLLMRNDLSESLCSQVQRPFLVTLAKNFYLLRTAYMFYKMHIEKVKAPEIKEQQFFRLFLSLHELQEMSQSNGSQFVLIVMDNPIDDDRLLMKAINKLHIPTLNPGGEFWQQISETIPHEGHLTCRGNRSIGTAIADWLARKGLVFPVQ